MHKLFGLVESCLKVYSYIPYSKAKLLEVADLNCDLDKPSLAVGKMHIPDFTFRS